MKYNNKANHYLFIFDIKDQDTEGNSLYKAFKALFVQTNGQTLPEGFIKRVSSRSLMIPKKYFKTHKNAGAHKATLLAFFIKHYKTLGTFGTDPNELFKNFDHQSSLVLAPNQETYSPAVHQFQQSRTYAEYTCRLESGKYCFVFSHELLSLIIWKKLHKALETLPDKSTADAKGTNCTLIDGDIPSTSEFSLSINCDDESAKNLIFKQLLLHNATFKKSTAVDFFDYLSKRITRSVENQATSKLRPAEPEEHDESYNNINTLISELTAILKTRETKVYSHFSGKMNAETIKSADQELGSLQASILKRIDLLTKINEIYANKITTLSDKYSGLLKLFNKEISPLLFNSTDIFNDDFETLNDLLEMYSAILRNKPIKQPPFPAIPSSSTPPARNSQTKLAPKKLKRRGSFQIPRFTTLTRKSADESGRHSIENGTRKHTGGMFGMFSPRGRRKSNGNGKPAQKLAKT